MKKLINDPQNVVAEALLGIEAAHPDLNVDHQHKIIYRGDGPHRGKVGIISGGGSGHEPLHGGFVGLGMLDAACAGEVFTSPWPRPRAAARSCPWSPTTTSRFRTAPGPRDVAESGSPC